MKFRFKITDQNYANFFIISSTSLFFCFLPKSKYRKNTIIFFLKRLGPSVTLAYHTLSRGHVLRQQANFKKLVKFDNILKSLHAKSFHQGANVLFIENNSVVFQHGDEIHSQYRTPLIGHLPLLQLTSHLPPKGGNDLVTLRTDAYYLNETNHLSGH